MKKNYFISFLLFFACAASGVAFAQNTNTTTDATRSPISPALLCPDITESIKDPVKQIWSAQTKAGAWKSYTLSFATKLTQFYGAQWAGEKMGQVTCVYGSEQQLTVRGNPFTEPTISVTLVFHTLAIEPSGGHWKKAKAGVYNCKSNDQKDCAFHVRINPETGNIFEEAESLKSNSDLSD